MIALFAAQAASRLLLPLAAVFTLYLAGHGGVGAGLQGALTLSVALVLHIAAFGAARTRQALPRPILVAAWTIGFLLLIAICLAPSLPHSATLSAFASLLGFAGAFAMLALDGAPEGG